MFKKTLMFGAIFNLAVCQHIFSADTIKPFDDVERSPSHSYFSLPRIIKGAVSLVAAIWGGSSLPLADARQVTLYPHSRDPKLARREIIGIGGTMPYSLGNEVVIAHFPDSFNYSLAENLEWSSLEPSAYLSVEARSFAELFDDKEGSDSDLLSSYGTDSSTSLSKSSYLRRNRKSDSFRGAHLPIQFQLDPYEPIEPVYPIQGTIVIGQYCPRAYVQIGYYACFDYNKTVLSNALMDVANYYHEQAGTAGEPLPNFIFTPFGTPEIELVKFPPTDQGWSAWIDFWLPPTLSALGYNDNKALVEANMRIYGATGGFNFFATVMPGPAGALGIARPKDLSMFSSVYTNKVQSDYFQILRHETAHIYGALDEYDDGVHICDCGVSGANKIPDGNCESQSGCGTRPSTSCFMNAGYVSSLNLCRFSRGQIGWGWWKPQSISFPVLNIDPTLKTFNSTAGLRLFAAGPVSGAGDNILITRLDTTSGAWSTPYTLSGARTDMPVSLKNSEQTQKLYLTYQAAAGSLPYSGQITILETGTGDSPSSWSSAIAATNICANTIGGHAMTIGTYGGGVRPPLNFYIVVYGKACSGTPAQEGLYIGYKMIGSTGPISLELLTTNPSYMPNAPLSIITIYKTNPYLPYLVAFCKGSVDDELGTPYISYVNNNAEIKIDPIVSYPTVSCESGRKMGLTSLESVAGGGDTYYLYFARYIGSKGLMNVLSTSNSAAKINTWYRTRYDMLGLSSDADYSVASYTPDGTNFELAMLHFNATSGVFEFKRSKGYF